MSLDKSWTTSDTSSDAPPTYGESSINAVASRLNNTSISELDVHGEIPNVSQTICHLKLLHAFSKLREHISHVDGLFGIYDIPDNEPFDDFDDLKHTRALLRLRIRGKRWAVYVQRAADRFAKWWSAMRHQRRADCLYLDEMGRSSKKYLMAVTGDGTSPDSGWSSDFLPPLDILMIWHAFMLNPHDYLQDCLRQDMMSLWQRGIPWTFIDEAIDTDTGLYTVSIQHQQSFEVLLSTNSGPMTHWDNLHDDVEKVVECPKCQYEVISNPGQERVAWTETGVAFAATASKLTRTKGHPPRSRSQQEKDAKAVQEAAECGTGFADRDFSVQCRRCHTRIDHEAMRAGSFLMDAVSWKLPLNRIRNHFEQKGASGSVPMKGTLLSGDGTPIEGYGGSRDDTGRSFANKLVAGIMVNRTPNTCWSSMAYTRQQIEMSLKDWSVLEYAMRTSKSRIFVPRANRMSVRRMMSKYWNNASIFSTDLAAACIRQGSFVEKMSEIDWLHSPAVAATMPRLIIKYQRFFDIMSSYPKDMTVPTLDVDLAWHTHQLMPRSYYDYSLKQTGGRFIDHDDKVGEIKLSTSFAKTSERYQKMYNEPYSQCTCWYCEAIRAEHTSNVSRLLHPASNKSIDAQLHSAGESGVHISAHSVIRPQLPRSGTYRYRGAIENYEKKLRAAYDKACKRARKEGRPPPAPPRALDERSSSSSERKDPNTHDAYLYSLALYPFPVGYVPAPYAVAPAACPGMYLADPGCATAVPGAVGNCAAGTCGAGVAAGAGAGAGSLCAGTHFGGCVGGAMAGGGCGGGGGGGCGGGGGGGCGGGGA